MLSVPAKSCLHCHSKRSKTVPRKSWSERQTIIGSRIEVPPSIISRSKARLRGKHRKGVMMQSLLSHVYRLSSRPKEDRRTSVYGITSKKAVRLQTAHGSICAASFLLDKRVFVARITLCSRAKRNNDIFVNFKYNMIL